MGRSRLVVLAAALLVAAADAAVGAPGESRSAWGGGRQRGVAAAALAVFEAHGDVDPAGPCAAPIAAHCASDAATSAKPAARLLLDDAPPAGSKPWHADHTALVRALERLADRPGGVDGAGWAGEKARCLQGVIAAERLSIAPKAGKLSIPPACRTQVRAFYALRFANFTRDAPLLRVCLRDAVELCGSAEVGEGNVLKCLKENKGKTMPRCAEAVTSRQAEQADDIALDPRLERACRADLDRFCKDVGYGSGVQLQCLKTQRAKSRLSISRQCRAAMFGREIDEAEDIRFDAWARGACAADKTRFCSEVPVGKGRVLECLNDHVKEPDFTSECKALLVRKQLRSAMDFRLDFRLKTACKKDVQALCGDVLANTADKSLPMGGTVLECLKENVDKISVKACKNRVTSKIQAASKDVRMDVPVMNACKQEIAEHCKDVKTGGGRVWQCLRSVKPQIGGECGKKLFKQQVLETKDWRYSFGVVKNCGNERQALCKDVEDGYGRVLRCLRLNLYHPEMSKECAETTRGLAIASASDVRLNLEVRTACNSEVKAMCANSSPGKGRVLRCLQQNRAKIVAPACRGAVLNFMTAKAGDFMLDYPLAAACQSDVQTHCEEFIMAHAGMPGDVTGGGSVHMCLRGKMEKLSPECREEEVRAMSNEMEDVRLQPSVRSKCSDAMATSCADVKPGDGRVIACLIAKRSEPGFNQQCAEQMKQVLEKQGSSITLSPQVRDACKADLPRLCSSSASKALDDLADGLPDDTMQCLAENHASASETCRPAVLGLVKALLSDYRPGVALTKSCDPDAAKLCGVAGSNEAYLAKGSVRDCLLRKHEEISAECWAVASAALPERDPEVQAAAKGIISKVMKGLDSSVRQTTETSSSAIISVAQSAVRSKLQEETAHKSNLLTILSVAIVVLAVVVVSLVFRSTAGGGAVGKGVMYVDKS